MLEAFLTIHARSSLTADLSPHRYTDLDGVFGELEKLDKRSTRIEVSYQKAYVANPHWSCGEVSEAARIYDSTNAR
jgi:hypothetical protein